MGKEKKVYFSLHMAIQSTGVHLDRLRQLGAGKGSKSLVVKVTNS